MSDQLEAATDGTAPGDRQRSAVPGTVLTILGLLVWLLASVTARDEPRSYTDGGPPPQYVTVAAGHTYSLAIPGGVPELKKLLDPNALTCTLSPKGGTAVPLAVVPETSDKAVDQIATFVPRVGGQVHIACPAAGEVYVDGAEGQFDLAGALILLATALLVIGVPLLLSSLAGTHRRNVARRSKPRQDVAGRAAEWSGTVSG